MKLVIPGKDPHGDPELREFVRGRIAENGGRITFAEFMTHALQHPRLGYYRRGRTRAGHGGDFLTSPEAHPVFAAAVARQLEAFRETLERTHATFVEAGAGTGTLANDVAAALPAATVVAVDTGAHVHPAEGTPARLAPRRVRADALPFAAGSIDGVYANELLDALPVHRLRRAGAGWRELFVGVGGDRFVWTEDEAAPESLAAAERALRRGAKPAEGQLVEVCPAAEAWIREAARVIGRGFLLLADYGDDTPALWTPSRSAGTLRCFAGHAVHDDPLVFLGTQDLTAHVDFGAVVEAGRAAGLDAVAFLGQREWLDAWGVAEAARGLASLGIRPDEIEVNRHAIDFVRDPNGLGKVRVLCLAKGVSPRPIAGLTGRAPPDRRLTAETLPLTRLPDPFADLYE
jgi:SAM-dependent MidA family methyltransferase